MERHLYSLGSESQLAALGRFTTAEDVVKHIVAEYKSTTLELLNGGPFMVPDTEEWQARLRADRRVAKELLITLGQRELVTEVEEIARGELETRNLPADVLDDEIQTSPSGPLPNLARDSI